MAIVILIGSRMDLYAMLYALWLCLLITPRRHLLAKIWPVFKIFIIITIPLQYAFVVGLPPFLCIGKIFCQSTIYYLYSYLFEINNSNSSETPGFILI